MFIFHGFFSLYTLFLYLQNMLTIETLIFQESIIFLVKSNTANLCVWPDRTIFP